MRGADLIVAMRRSGVRPMHVHLLDFPANPRQPRYVDDWAYMDVSTHEQPLHALDFRFLISIPVTVTSTDTRRRDALCDMAQKAGAAEVSGFCTADRSVVILKDGQWLKF
jgi:hypothetical protein